MSNSESNISVPRVLQLDAVDLDKSITELLTDQLLTIKQYLPPGFLDKVKPEIRLIMELLLFKNSVYSSSQCHTFGQQLFGLKYEELLTKRKALFYVIINYLMPYFGERLELLDGGSMTRGIVIKIVNSFQICQLVNFLVFLRQGQYPTICDRILKMRYVPVDKLNKSFGYNLMVRELLWHGFMELLMSGLPLVNIPKLKRMCLGIWRRKSPLVDQIPNISLNENTLCSICKNRPTTPCRISIYCRHVACYYCIQANILADEKYSCPDCGVVNTARNQLQYCC